MKELGIRNSVFEPQFTQSDKTVFTEELKETLIQLGPQGWCGALAALLSPLVGQDLYRQVSVTDQQAKSIHKWERSLEEIRKR